MQPPIRIAITPGEPAGIGPELVLKLAQQNLSFEPVAIVDRQLLTSLARQLNIETAITLFSPNDKYVSHKPGQLKVVDIPVPNQVTLGEPDNRNSRYVIDTLKTAIDLVQRGICQALTTGPVQKSIINQAGISFTGHTEFIAEITGGNPVMMLSNEAGLTEPAQLLRIAFVTTHIAVTDIPAWITAQRIENVLQVLHGDLNRLFGIRDPRISVCGLNPHAGENGYLGSEEKEIIAPCLERLRKQGMKLEGPLPADTAFVQKNLRSTDAVLAMYHDQGLPVIKFSNFGGVVNLTLGLPIIRTSVDHGTALDISGRGVANVHSLHNAASLAEKLAVKLPWGKANQSEPTGSEADSAVLMH